MAASMHRVMIHLSQSAIGEIRRIKAKHSNTAVMFRLGVQAGGCADFYYTLALDTVQTPSDQVFNCEGVQVVIDSQSLQYLENLNLDYSEDLMGGGFRFDNPQAASSCGCGNSFSVETAANQDSSQ